MAAVSHFVFYAVHLDCKPYPIPCLARLDLLRIHAWHPGQFQRTLLPRHSSKSDSQVIPLPMFPSVLVLSLLVLLCSTIPRIRPPLIYSPRMPLLIFSCGLTQPSPVMSISFTLAVCLFIYLFIHYWDLYAHLSPPGYSIKITTYVLKCQ